MKRLWLGIALCLLPGRTAHSAEVTPEYVLQIGPQMSVTALDYSPDGRLLASGGGGGWGSAAGEIIIWDAASGEVWRTLPASDGPVTLVRFVAHGTQLATATTVSHGTPADGIVRFWDVPSGRLLRALPAPGPVFAVAVSDDGNWVARSEPSSETIHAASQKRLTLENAVTGDKRPLAATGVVYRLAFSSDARTLFGADARGLEAWDVATGQARTLPPAQLENKTALPRRMELVEHTPRLPEFSPDGQLFVDVAPGGVGVWESATGRRRAWLPLAAQRNAQPGTEPGAAPTAAVFFDGGRQVALRMGATVRLWNTVSGTVESPKAGPQPLVASDAGALAVAPDGGTVAVGVRRWGDREVRTREIISEIHLLAVPGGATRRVLTGRANPPRWVGFTPDGQTILSTWHDTGVRCWNARTGQLEDNRAATPGANEALAVSRDGTLIGRGNGFRSRSAGTQIARDGSDPFVTVAGRHGLIQHIAFAPDGRRVSISDGVEVTLCELPSGHVLNRFAGHGGMIFSTAFSPDGQLLATCGGGDGTVNLWHLADGELIGRLSDRNDTVEEAVFSPDRRLIASRGSRAVWLWDTATQTPLLRWPRGVAEPSAIAFSPDGATLAIAENRTVRFYDVRNVPAAQAALRDGPHDGAAPQRTLTSPGGAVLSLAFAPDGATLAAACADSAIYLGNTNTGQWRATLRALPPPRDGEVSQEWMALTPDGFFDGSPGAAEFLRWRQDDAWLPDGAARFHQPERVQRALLP